MGFYEEHIAAVASRMAHWMKQGRKPETIERYLKYCGWKEFEVKRIIANAKKLASGGKYEQID
jgi:hypothetical protein